MRNQASFMPFSSLCHFLWIHSIFSFKYCLFDYNISRHHCFCFIIWGAFFFWLLDVLGSGSLFSTKLGRHFTIIYSIGFFFFFLFSPLISPLFLGLLLYGYWYNGLDLVSQVTEALPFLSLYFSVFVLDSFYYHVFSSTDLFCCFLWSVIKPNQLVFHLRYDTSV